MALRDAMLAQGLASGHGLFPRLHGSRVAQAGLCGRHGEFREHARLEAAERVAAALGTIFSRNMGTNQKGELVYSFIGSVFIERRPA